LTPSHELYIQHIEAFMQHDAKLRKVVDQLARECLGVRLRMIHRGVSGIYEKAFRPHGLRAGQMTILVAVAYEEAVKPSCLCRALHIEKSTLSRDVAGLRRKGWLESEPDPEGRGNRLRLSPAGAALLEKVFPAWLKAQQQVAELLGKAGIEAVHGAAGRLGFPACGK
jgi:DNA-binding MarR family transcriptional regulator